MRDTIAKTANDYGMDQHTACHHCDQLIHLPHLQEGQEAHCPRCGHLVAALRFNAMNKALACGASALLFLLLANLFPFLSFRAQGREQVMTLGQSSIELLTQGHPVLALLITIFILLIPAVMLTVLLYLLIPLRQRRYPRYGYLLCRYLYLLKPWSMVEVFLIGVLVSLIKIASMADVILGISFWAYILFSLLLTAALSSVDRHHLWFWLEQAREN